MGACLADQDGNILGRGHNQRVQQGDPTIHGETDAFKQAGRQRGYQKKIMVTTLAPCWYCSGLIRQFNIGTVVVGESVNFQGGVDWLRENGVMVIDLHNQECIQMMEEFIEANPNFGRKILASKKEMVGKRCCGYPGWRAGVRLS